MLKLLFFKKNTLYVIILKDNKWNLFLYTVRCKGSELYENSR